MENSNAKNALDKILITQNHNYLKTNKL